MTDQALLANGVDEESRTRILNFVQEHEAEVTAWLAEQFQDSYLYPEFLEEFRDSYLPWLWEVEVEELAGLAAAGDVRLVMDDWDEHMNLHPDRRESFWEVTARDGDLPDLVRKGIQFDRLWAQVQKLRADNATLRVAMGDEQ